MSRTMRRAAEGGPWERGAKQLCAGFGVVRVFLFNVAGRKGRPATLNRKTRFNPKVEFWGFRVQHVLTRAVLCEHSLRDRIAPEKRKKGKRKKRKQEKKKKRKEKKEKSKKKEKRKKGTKKEKKKKKEKRRKKEEKRKKEKKKKEEKKNKRKKEKMPTLYAVYGVYHTDELARFCD